MRLFTDLLSWIAAHIVVFWWERENRSTPHRCDAGNEDRCRHGVAPSDNCLVCAIEAPDDDTPLTKTIMRNEWVNSIEQWLEMQKGKH
jgi:hypothetical protein